MICVYPAGKIQGDSLLESLRNINAGIEWTATLRKLGYAPFPVFEDFMDIMRTDPGIDIELVYAASLAWLQRADCMFVTPGWETSYDTKQEIAHCEKHGVPVFYTLEELARFRRSKIDEMHTIA